MGVADYSKWRMVITGPIVRLYNGYKLRSRHLVTADLLKLWYDLTIDNNFDTELFRSLSDSDKNAFLKMYDFNIKKYNKRSPKYEMFLAKEAKPLTDRLKLLEGEILAGNLNPQLISDYSDILNQLVDRNILSNIQKTTLIRRLELTYDMLRDSEVITNLVK